jgi:site-specific DNA-cytosine methylase
MRLRDILETDVDDKYYLSEETVSRFITAENSKESLLYDGCQSKREGKSREYNDYSPTLSARDYKDPRMINNNKSNFHIRKLTPKECWRLMGFADADFEKAAQFNSNSQLYKQAGNSIVVDVLYYIFGMML